jgi:hypothetical protein
MVGLPFYCLVQACGFVGFSAIWLYYTTYLVSSAEITTNKDPTTGASYKEYEYSDRAKQAVSSVRLSSSLTIHSPTGHLHGLHVAMDHCFYSGDRTGILPPSPPLPDPDSWLQLTRVSCGTSLTPEMASLAFRSVLHPATSLTSDGLSSDLLFIEYGHQISLWDGCLWFSDSGDHQHGPNHPHLHQEEILRSGGRVQSMSHSVIYLL